MALTTTFADPLMDFWTDPFFNDFFEDIMTPDITSLTGPLRRRGRRRMEPPYQPAYWRPRTNLFQEGEEYIAEFELPGIKRENIELRVDGNALVLSSTKLPSRKEEQAVYYQRERHFGDFYRRVLLPEPVDPDSINARMENGVLKVTMRRRRGGEVKHVAIQ
jgi:HSP20 family protein